MTLQPINYRGRLVAAATRDRFFLSGELERRPADDPERTFVIFMAAYAGDVLNGELPGPYTDHNARRYARAALIPTELLDDVACSAFFQSLFHLETMLCADTGTRTSAAATRAAPSWCASAEAPPSSVWPRGAAPGAPAPAFPACSPT